MDNKFALKKKEKEFSFYCFSLPDSCETFPEKENVILLFIKILAEPFIIVCIPDLI